MCRLEENATGWLLVPTFPTILWGMKCGLHEDHCGVFQVKGTDVCAIAEYSFRRNKTQCTEQPVCVCVCVYSCQTDPNVAWHDVGNIIAVCYNGISYDLSCLYCHSKYWRDVVVCVQRLGWFKAQRRSSTSESLCVCVCVYMYMYMCVYVIIFKSLGFHNFFKYIFWIKPPLLTKDTLICPEIQQKHIVIYYITVIL